jgi:plasmid stabilization system protein ParE
VKRYQVVVTAAAERDLRAIRAFIAGDSPGAATAFLVVLRRPIEGLEALPLRGSVIPEADLLGVPYRHIVHGNYRTLYRVDGERVLVLRVLHGAWLWPAVSDESNPRADCGTLDVEPLASGRLNRP